MSRLIDGLQPVSSRSKNSSPTPLEVGKRIQSRLDSLHALPRKWTLVLGLVLIILGLASAGIALGTDLGTLQAVRQVLPPGHYLVLFQNNAEQRPSGGFLGSFATIDITPSSVHHLNIETNIYKRDDVFAQMHPMEPPAPFEGVSEYWTMRDSNWDPDFRDAARRVSWFYEQEGGEPVDGVIAVNASVLQDFLRMTGPLSIEGWDEPLSSENFFALLASKIEREYFHSPDNRAQNEPKSILSDLVPLLKQRVANPLHAIAMPRLLAKELAEKQIQLYHTDPRVQELILSQDWGGAITKTDGDYLSLINASLGGQKSSLNVSQSVQLTVESDAEVARHVLTIRRQHNGTGVWPDHDSEDYLRILVPSMARLARAQLNDKTITEEVDQRIEAGKLSLGHHVSTKIGTMSELVLEYHTEPLQSPYSLIYQKQSGVISELLQVTYNGATLYEGEITRDIAIQDK